MTLLIGLCGFTSACTFKFADGAHTLTCALMLLNTDLHGHVCIYVKHMYVYVKYLTYFLPGGPYQT